MFEGILTNPLFWTMVLAVIVGYVAAKALPYILAAIVYVVMIAVYGLGLIVGALLGIAILTANAVKAAVKGQK